MELGTYWLPLALAGLGIAATAVFWWAIGRPPPKAGE
jgi:hypothetical protein